jgi:hypothetical protein
MAEIVSRLGTEPQAILRITAVSQIATTPAMSPSFRPPIQAPRK